jgi:hypothetical protein
MMLCWLAAGFVWSRNQESLPDFCGFPLGSNYIYIYTNIYTHIVGVMHATHVVGVLID